MDALEPILTLFAEPTTALLIATSFISALMTAALGIGGGTLLLAVMALVLPASAIIPVHGVVQLGANVSRTALLIQYLNWPILAAFAAGAVIGAAFGGYLAISLPGTILRPLLGLFILYSVWGPKLVQSSASRSALALGGAITTFLTMLVGATGPLVLSIIRTLQLAPANTVATNSACVLVQHGLKVLAFGVLGFSFYPYLGLIGAMLIMGLIGTWIGKTILLKTPPAQFDWVLKLLLTALAVPLLWT